MATVTTNNWAYAVLSSGVPKYWSSSFQYIPDTWLFNASAPADMWRNIDDEQLRAVAATGGTVGIMFQQSFLGSGHVDARTVVDHIDHVIRVIGEDHVSLGTDYDGAISPPKDLPTLFELPRIVQVMLERGHSPERIGKVLGGNFLRTVEALRG